MVVNIYYQESRGGVRFSYFSKRKEPCASGGHSGLSCAFAHSAYKCVSSRVTVVEWGKILASSVQWLSHV